MSLQLAKSDAMQKQIDLFEQLEQAKQQLRQLNDYKKREVSPLPPSGARYYQPDSVQQSVQKPPANERYQLYPAGYQS